ncbi:prolipoprotein diacylglyceryl transferase [Sphingopyxis sp. Root1497]|jgi:phosphatidylglycerol---prolipoprotein diacylglyceryl transferase|uniref:prolipoprotein diacylglyceryl transferase n=1 Tax=Sphingopyxis sp. Root1497 TaxID=1736474 RepID=UPI0007001300|nr:prolipoprotein diacylglyceryl transferase [Sphingopyxis sp. Root1497]OHD00792.1 MAG: prolipoprotein diacylglyceryl transferase [Sphingopyxis sp. RIFCSPHIGHO2_01_FULL_65_24]
MFLFATLAEATQYVNFHDLMGENSEIAFSVFGWPIRWYALAYLAGIFLGYWYLLKLIDQPGAPMARRHADDMIFYAMLGIILGGRLGYVLFYNLEAYIQKPATIFKLWDGGMSLHGGVIGVLIAIWYVTRKEKLSFLRFCDYVACVIPFGLFLGRIANFVNGELWGRISYVPWAIIFPGEAGPLPRHPSQLYEAGLEGLLMMAVLTWLFWRTDARYKPGLLVGMASIIYGVSRFAVEFVRNPDSQRMWVVESTGLSMGQWLTVPMIVIGLWLVLTAKRRRQRVEPIAGPDSVA